MEKRRERRHLRLTKCEGICKRFDYIRNRIESAKILSTGYKIRDRSIRTGQWSCFFYFQRKNGRVGSFKTGSVCKPLTHLFFFGLRQKNSCVSGSLPEKNRVGRLFFFTFFSSLSFLCYKTVLKFLKYVVVFVFIVPPTAKVTWRWGQGLTSYPTDW